MSDADADGVVDSAIDEDLAKELEKYKGQWVAIDGGRLVAAGQSASDVVGQALKMGVTDPVVFRVPLHPERVSFL